MVRMDVTVEGQTYQIEVDLDCGGSSHVTAWVDGKPVRVVMPDNDAVQEDAQCFVIDNRPYEFDADPNLRWIRSHGGTHQLQWRDLNNCRTVRRTRDGCVRAPIPGQVRRVAVANGDRVEAGQRLLVLEAMKMENEIRAPHSGVVTELSVGPGQNVSRDQLLVAIS